MKAIAGSESTVWRGIKLPPALLVLAQAIYPAMEAFGKDWLDGAKGFLTRQQKIEALTFLKTVLDGDYSNAEIKGLLNAMATGITVRGGSKAARAFLERLAGELSKDCAQ